MPIEKGGIAFFDSGIGGLTVLKSCEEILKGEIIYYYGDNARAPYGNLSPKKIKKYVRQAFKKFRRLRVKAVVVACNTVTALCVEELRKKYTFPIIGTEPAVLTASNEGGDVFVLSTMATYQSKRFRALCTRIAKKGTCKIIPYACERLAGEIETHIFEGDYDYTPLLPIGNPNAVVLGCTHYIYIKESIKNFYHCPVYDGNEGIAKRLRTILTSIRQNSPHFSKHSGIFWDRKPPTRFFCPNDPERKEQEVRKLKENCTNKCSWLRFFTLSKKVGKIYFLGSGKKQNKRVCERMFANF